MEKRGLVVLSIVILVLFNVMGAVLAEKIGIDIKNDNSGNIINYKITLYDSNNNKIAGDVNYKIEDYYTDVVEEGKVSSGEENSYHLPKNPVQGPWKITATFNDQSVNELFNVGKIEKAGIRLEADNLVIENVGNVPYERKLLISIADQSETADVYLEVGQTTKIKLTAPTGSYTVKVNDGTDENDLTFSGVSLTGNVIGLERVIEGNFFSRFPLVSLFIAVLVIVMLVIIGHRTYAKYYESNNKKKKKLP